MQEMPNFCLKCDNFYCLFRNRCCIPNDCCSPQNSSLAFDDVHIQQSNTYDSNRISFLSRPLPLSDSPTLSLSRFFSLYTGNSPPTLNAQSGIPEIAYFGPKINLAL